jgi:hypothetical protein
MATKGTKDKGKAKTKKSMKKQSKSATKPKKTASTKKAAEAQKHAKPLKQVMKAPAKGIKCCEHCPDFEYCEDKGVCCDYCDFFLNAKCTFGKKKGIPSMNQSVELPDYRGDDFGIDDYEAYEPVYE